MFVISPLGNGIEALKIICVGVKYERDLQKHNVKEFSSSIKTFVFEINDKEQYEEHIISLMIL